MSKAKKTRSKSPDWQQQMEDFFHSPLAEKAASALSERASIALHVDGHHFLFFRRNGKNTMESTTQAESTADVDFWVPLSAMRQLLAEAENPDISISRMGVLVLEHLFAKDAEQKIKFRVNTGFLGLWSKGYFSVLKAGGPEVASLLARFGFNSIARIKDVLRQLRT